MDEFIEGIFTIVIATAIGLFETLIVYILFSLSDIPALDALSYWQTFAVVMAVSIMTNKPRDYGLDLI